MNQIEKEKIEKIIKGTSQHSKSLQTALLFFLFVLLG